MAKICAPIKIGYCLPLLVNLFKTRIIVGIFIISIGMMATILTTDAYAQDQSDLDRQREEDLEKWPEYGFDNVNVILKETNHIVIKPDSSIDELMSAAKRANTAANLVGYIVKGYSDYHRENYMYEFIQDKVQPAHDAYVEISNSLKDVRNRAYLRIGDLLASEGNSIEAFFYYRDAFRLAVFDSGDKGIRYQSEQRMKSLLGLESIDSYVSWKKSGE